MGTYNGGEGNDSVKGSNNNDVINGRAGNDSLQGLNGADLIISGSGNDTIDAGDGDDLVVCGTLTSGNSGGLNYAVAEEILKVNLGAGDDFIAFHSTLLDGSYIIGGLGIDTINLAQSSGIRTEQEIKKITGFENWILTGNMGVQIGAKELLQKNIYSGIYTDLVIEPNSIKIYNENVEGLSKTLTVFYEAVNGNVFDASAVDYAGIAILSTTSSGATSKIIGSQRADNVIGSGSSDEIKGEGGDDIINGGDGVDTAIYSGNYSNYTISEITYNTFAVKDNVGTDGTDIIIDVNKLQFADQTVNVEIKGMEIIGDDSAEEITGGDEADRIDGAGGNDLLNGGLGNDLVEGGTGNDDLIGAQGNDFLEGGAGVDELIGGAGNDELDGGANDDLANYSGVESDLTINLTTGVATGEGTDTLISIEDVIGGTKNDTITGNDANNEITAGSGDDVVNAGGGDDLIVGGDGAGNDRYLGGTGIDTIKYTSAKSGITVNLAATKDHAKSTLSGDKAGIGVDQLSGIENIIAGNFDDLLTGNSVANRIEAGSGNDTLDGSSGTDVLIGGSGNDTYIVDLYKKTSTTLALQDTVTEAASAGTDTLKLRLTSDQKLAAQTFTLAANLENLDASNTSTNLINLTGNAAANNLTGNAAANTLKGEAGSDILYGGLGSDSLYGGAGDKVKDVFDFNAITESKVGTARDKVYDFVTNIDKIDLSGIDANSATAKTGDQAFLFKGTTATANSVWYKVMDADGNTATKDIVIYGDVDGNTTADFEIGLVGVTSLTSADFVL